MLRTHSDILAALAAATISAAIVLAPFDAGPIRVAAALLMVLVLPGYAIVTAAAPGRAITRAEQILLAGVMSLAAAILTGLALNLTPWGLAAPAWAASLWGITLVAGLVALARRQGLPADARPARHPFRFGWRYAVLTGLAGVIAIAAVSLARLPTPSQGLQGYTLLWALPAGDARTVRIGITSDEFSTTDYTLTLRSGNLVLRKWSSITLGPGEQWETQWEMPGDKAIYPVEGVLDLSTSTSRRADAPGPAYRHIIIWNK